MIDAKGKTVVPLKYEELNDFSEGMASFRKGEKWGFIDRTGKEVIPAQYDLNGNFGGYYGFSEGVANVGKNSKWGAIDKKLVKLLYRLFMTIFNQCLKASWAFKKVSIGICR